MGECNIQAVDFFPPEKTRNIQQLVINIFPTGSWCVCAQVTRPVLKLEDTFILYQQKNSINKSVATTDTNIQRSRECEPGCRFHALKAGILTFAVTKSVLKNLCRVEMSFPLPYWLNKQVSEFQMWECEESAEKLLKYTLSKLVSFIL